MGWHPKWELDKTLDKVVEWNDAYHAGRNMQDICLKQISEYMIEKPVRDFDEQPLNRNSSAEDIWNDLDAFEAASLETFFQGNDDKDVDWLEIFDVKNL